MKRLLTLILACATTLITTGCSVLGQGDTEIAPYKVLGAADTEKQIELRYYESLVLVSTRMGASMDEGRNSAFRKLFGYISGDNSGQQKVSMTAPVFMDDAYKGEGQKISMTAPVFMDEESDNMGGAAMMSFVLPKSFTIDSAPVPTNPDVTLHEITGYTVAAITFSGLLSQSNINKNKAVLEKWIDTQGYEQTGPYKAAGYNPPFTIPALRRNEVLIPVKKID